MKSIPKWFLLPPAAALLLVLGPLSMQGANTPTSEATPSSATTVEPARPDEAPAPRSRTGRPTPAPATARLPELWQVGCALGGVLLLGTVGVLALRRLRNGSRPGGATGLVGVRQTVRLSARLALHVVEFEDRLLLVGEADRGLSLLDSGRSPDRAADEAAVLERSRAQNPATVETEDDLGEGATPRNLVIPRPERPALRRLPTPPVQPGTGGRAPTGLNDFRALLQKAGRA